MYEFKKYKGGLHQIGGKKPDDLNYPQNKFTGNFQYVAFINNKDKLFEWLPFGLHLICPIYLNIEQLFLDYTDPKNPKITVPEDSSIIDSEYDELALDSLNLNRLK